MEEIEEYCDIGREDGLADDLHLEEQILPLILEIVRFGLSFKSIILSCQISLVRSSSFSTATSTPHSLISSTHSMVFS